MCGLAGELRLDTQRPDLAAVERMAATMDPRGPDAAGTWSHGRIALGHRRLKIIDLSEAGAQPITIGMAVRAVKPDGRLAAVPIGTHSARFSEGARVTIFTDDAEVFYLGTVLPLKASGHAYGDAVDTQGVGWEHVEIRIDEHVHSVADVAALGIEVGDFVAHHTLPEITRSGFVKSRHLDDKAGVAAALAAFKAVSESGVEVPVTAHLLITIAEEVGHGASHGLHKDVAEMVSIDSAVVAPCQRSAETGVTVAMQDATGPFDYHLTRRLAALCREHGIEHRRDVFRY